MLVGTWALMVVLARRLPEGAAKDLATVLPACATTGAGFDGIGVRVERRIGRRHRVALGLSPIDLIPEFLPIIGPLDDVLVVALAFRIAVACQVPRAVLFEAWPADPLVLERLLPGRSLPAWCAKRLPPFRR